MEADLKLLLNNAIATAEAVLLDAESRLLHPPTVEFFRGQKILAEQVLAMLENKTEPDEILHGKIANGRLVVYNTAGEQVEFVF